MNAATPALDVTIQRDARIEVAGSKLILIIEDDDDGRLSVLVFDAARLLGQLFVWPDGVEVKPAGRAESVTVEWPAV